MWLVSADARGGGTRDEALGVSAWEDSFGPESVLLVLTKRKAVSGKDLLGSRGKEELKSTNNTIALALALIKGRKEA